MEGTITGTTPSLKSVDSQALKVSAIEFRYEFEGVFDHLFYKIRRNPKFRGRRRVFREREHNLGQTASQRRSSITWDLPKSFTTDVKASDEPPISEDSEQNQDFETRDAESVAPITESKQNESVSQVFNKSDNLDEIHKELKNEEIIEELRVKENIIDKSVSNELQTSYKGSQLVTDILTIHTAVVMPEPSGAPIGFIQQKAVSLKSKAPKEQTNKTTEKTPKKKKVKKKDVLKVRKDLNENIVNEVILDKKKVLDLTPKRIKFRKYTFDDFNLLKVLGRGSFGKVLLAELKQHSVYFAIKCLKKHSVIEDDDIESIMIERKNYLCFAMEWCCGGDLMFHVQKSGKFDENKARFYASEILCAVEFMHSKGIVYRDLKLDNIMIDQKGHLRLVDFGMCLGQIYREDLLPSNFCGTPEYMAPEIIKGVKYNQSVDFWSFGVLLYEMVVGTSPFHGTDEEELLWNLLSKAPEQRLGMPTCPAGSIRSQTFFKGVEWTKVEKCQIKAPFIPELSSPFDVSYFDEYFTKEEPNLTPVCPKITQSIDQTLFDGFSYTNHKMTD
ncbi:unnamed protein product [Oppiella nova]|uniref:Uncharacterized protein n=1 Tax=Oppiella nova TaxID=334625 RepID=A0A7R9Q985_9ACAR|nr:unnamed protein product [Oppiella nova]CAG2160272.1 unnamed protein product [Oppiella nova]